MKNKILKFLKKWWWKTLIFILCNFLGIVLFYFNYDFEKLRFLFKSFGVIGLLMFFGYFLIWICLAFFLISIIEFWKRFNNVIKNQKKGEVSND
ncbi:hypothetical protein [Spiroplasma endosymbiont of Sarcophaga variegata]|uniref:hypothetical protein n=1 Tax=Spiroplasma endosymbiont of Sarcophaga variegata TaxID=3066304 RepID=UPI003AF801D0